MKSNQKIWLVPVLGMMRSMYFLIFLFIHICTHSHACTHMHI